MTITSRPYATVYGLPDLPQNIHFVQVEGEVLQERVAQLGYLLWGRELFLILLLFLAEDPTFRRNCSPFCPSRIPFFPGFPTPDLAASRPPGSLGHQRPEWFEGEGFPVAGHSPASTLPLDPFVHMDQMGEWSTRPVS